MSHVVKYSRWLDNLFLRHNSLKRLQDSFLPTSAIFSYSKPGELKEPETSLGIADIDGNTIIYY